MSDPVLIEIGPRLASLLGGLAVCSLLAWLWRP